MLMLLLREVDYAYANKWYNTRSLTPAYRYISVSLSLRLIRKTTNTHLDCITRQTDRLTAGQCWASEPVLQYKQTVRNNSTVSVQ
jgi:hypothetical protein